MNEILHTGSTTAYRYLLGSPSTAGNWFRQIRATLSDPDLFGLFAEPVVLGSGDKIAWRSVCPGRPVGYNRLSDEDKGNAKTELRRKINKLMDKVKTFSDQKLAEFFNNCIEIPNLDSLYVVVDNNKAEIVISNWGFINDAPGAERGLINKYIDAKKVSLVFKIFYYKDGRKIPERIAPNVDVVFETGGNCLTVKSNNEGIVVLDGIKEETKVSVYETDDTDKLKPQIFKCYENGVYDVYVTPQGEMTFRIVDQFDNMLPNMEFVFEYSGKSERLVSDADGRIILANMKNQTRVDTYQYSGESNAKNNFNSFVYDFKDEYYKIVVYKEPPKAEPVVEPAPLETPQQPKEGNVTIKVLDDKGNVATDATVIVKYLGKKETYISDSQGFITIKDVPVGTKFEITAKK